MLVDYYIRIQYRIQYLCTYSNSTSVYIYLSLLKQDLEFGFDFTLENSISNQITDNNHLITKQTTAHHHKISTFLTHIIDISYMVNIVHFQDD